MARRERDVIENAIRVVAEQAAKADELVDEAIAAGLDGSHQVTIHAKMPRLELPERDTPLPKGEGGAWCQALRKMGDDGNLG